jgi:hypothetical protein
MLFQWDRAIQLVMFYAVLINHCRYLAGVVMRRLAPEKQLIEYYI